MKNAAELEQFKKLIPVGIENRVKLTEIAQSMQISYRRAKRLLAKLRQEDVPVGAIRNKQAGGIYIARNPAELEVSIRYLKAQVKREMAIIRKMETMRFEGEVKDEQRPTIGKIDTRC